MSNLYSVCKAIEQVNAVPKIISNPEELKTISKIILPGVGSFDSAIHSLQKKNFIEPLKTYIKNGMPFLGICLGFQLLMQNSEEVRNIPHIGWNSIQITNEKSPLWVDFNTNLWFYFIHSYYVCLDNKNIESAFVKYGNLNFTVAISLDNIMAVQFHPEKSSQSGLTILKNFTKMS
ncbi:[pt] glutamine amidotransferase [Galdieria sulphuraria]|uniref:[pt] glutamine amidotransferase n=1 Tax=Galdieria sulphuraria TaxID=130081 RepID=M2XET9_GALSU|nr:[pt] glutamine amidotransferase [Galdieria sulphuraria]EME28502.1 [pt] glutamine amidotransferase [Galdieria sulphuraria]|eukprot:XP_005705022.1 [pt] glutamine amidotransferase [Galdieria sulphuraria]